MSKKKKGNGPVVTKSQEPYTIRLSEESSDLIRWYCQITHHRPQHVVDGVVEGELNKAKEGYESDGDDSFDILLGQVLDAQMKAVGSSSLISSEFGANVQVESAAIDWLLRYVQDAQCSIHDAASAIIVSTLEKLYNGKKGRTSETVTDWPAWESLNAASRAVEHRRATSRRQLETAARA